MFTCSSLCNITGRRDEINGMRKKVLCSCESRLGEDYCTVWRITPGRALQYGGKLLGEHYSTEDHSWALQYGGPLVGEHYSREDHPLESTTDRGTLRGKHYSMQAHSWESTSMEAHSWESTTVWRPTPGRALQYGGPFLGRHYSMEDHSSPGRALQYGGPLLGEHYSTEDHSWESTTGWRTTPVRALQYLKGWAMKILTFKGGRDFLDPI
jgi:hypothetical protein